MGFFGLECAEPCCARNGGNDTGLATVAHTRRSEETGILATA